MKRLFEKLNTKFKKSRYSFGVDIGTSTIKLVLLKFGDGKAEVEDFILETSGPDLIQALKKVFQALGVKKTGAPSVFKSGVNMSVSGPNTIIRYAPFPKMSPDELKQALKFEAQKHIPFSVSEVDLDGYILKPDLADNKMLVLLAAAKKEFIDMRIKAAQEAGVRVNLIDINSIALINAFNFNYSDDQRIKNKTIALLNIGEATSNLNILDNGIPGLSRDIHIAGNNLTQKIADALRIDFKAAQDLKLNPGKENLAKVVAAVEAVFSSLAQETRASFDYYESHGMVPVQKIFLSGGGSLFSGASDMLTNLLGVEVEHWNPLARFNIEAHIDKERLNSLSARLAIAIGVALHS